MPDRFQRLAYRVSDVSGSPRAFATALAAVALWALAGPVFHFSDSWQLVINTATTVVTFLMVFLIQATQNRETRALHLKLDELVRAERRARNIFADLEHATDQELAELEEEFRRMRARAVAREEGARADAGRSGG